LKEILINDIFVRECVRVCTCKMIYLELFLTVDKLTQ